MKRQLFIPIWFLALLSLIHASAHAQLLLPKTSGFGGYFLFGPGIYNIESNLLASGPPFIQDIGDRQVASINEEANDNLAIPAVVSGELNYTFADSKTQIFLGNGLEDILRLDVPVGIGVRKQLNDGGMLMLRILTTPLTLKFWDDPYVEGEERDKTYMNFNGFRFRWSRILKTQFEITATLRNYNYDDEKSGDWLVSQGRLDADDQSLLDRNGFVYRFNLVYQFNLGKGQLLRPAVQYINDDHNGEAMANQGYSVKLAYIKRSQKMIFESRVLYGQRFAQEVHPVYDQLNDSYRFGGAVSVFIPTKLFGSNNWTFWLSGDYIQEHNEIDFFNSRIFGFMGGLLCRLNRE